MKSRLNFLSIISLIALSACSAAYEIKTQTATTSNIEQINTQNPPVTILQGKNKLNLFRIMDGAICKNGLEGAKGAFLLYADPNDIDRIKREKGAAMFGVLENKIQELSGDVLQEAIDNTNLSEDPFALDEDDAQQKLATQLTKNFRNAAFDAIARFKKETTLTIAIAAFYPSLIFYQRGCKATQDQTEASSSYGGLVPY